jgi:hypothetical protein
MPRPSHRPWNDRPNNVWWKVQSMNHLIMKYYPISCYFFPRVEMSSSASLYKALSIKIFPLAGETKFYAHTKQQVKLSSFVCILILTYFDRKEKAKDFCLNGCKHSSNFSCWLESIKCTILWKKMFRSVYQSDHCALQNFLSAVLIFYISVTEKATELILYFGILVDIIYCCLQYWH